MNTTDRIARAIAGVTGIVQVLLGLTLWTGRAPSFVPLHMAVGMLFVASLWALALRALRARAGGRVPAVALVWGAVVLAYGMVQARILPGPFHWIVQVVHLLVGIAAMGLAGRLGRALSEVGTRDAVHPIVSPARIRRRTGAPDSAA